MRPIVVVIVLLCTTNVFAQQRPLVTEDPETIGAGRILLEGGFNLESDLFYPISGLEGNRLSVPTIGVSIGLSSIAEIQFDGGFYQKLSITGQRDAPLSAVLELDDEDETHDVEDIVIATKIRLFGEGGARPAMGLRLATKLPTVSNESGLGTDMTDFFASLLIAKTIESVRVVGNVGFAIIGDPAPPAGVPEQDDMLTFGVSVARAMTNAAELVGEINGRLNTSNGEAHPGAENRALMRFGGRYTRGTVRVDAGVLVGMTARDPQFGVTAGFTWVFDAFRVP